MTIKNLSILKNITAWGGVLTTISGVVYGISQGGDIVSYSITLTGVVLTSAGHIIGIAQAKHQKAATIAAESRIEEARAEAAAAKQVAEALEAKQRARIITSDQREALISTLKHGPKGKVVVTFLSVERDAQKLAEQIVAVFKEAGFDATLSKHLWLQLALDGIYLTAKQEGQVPTHGPFIQKCFNDVGLPLKGFHNADFLKSVGCPDEGVVFAVSNRH